MFSRRAFLGLSAAALTAPAWPGFATAAAATPATFTLNLVDNSGSGTAYAYVTGTTSDNRLVLLAADGTPYYPPCLLYT
ncbi:beta-1,3-glucanase, partial [Amycolatopsis acidiphila]